MKKRQTVLSWWRHVPSTIRKPVVLVIGLVFIIAAGLTGWLPGPGGIPLFLIGIAILSTEFEWAERVRDYVLGILKDIGHWIKANPVRGTIGIVLFTVAFVGLAYLAYSRAPLP